MPKFDVEIPGLKNGEKPSNEQVVQAMKNDEAVQEYLDNLLKESFPGAKITKK